MKLFTVQNNTSKSYFYFTTVQNEPKSYYVVLKKYQYFLDECLQDFVSTIYSIYK